MFPSQTPGITAVLAPSAAVTKGKWVDGDGNVVSVAGSRARGIAFQNFSTAEVANTAGSPGNRLAVTIFGNTKTKLGGTVPDKSFVTCDANGDTIVATTASHEVLGYMERGGVAGDEREVFVLRNDDPRIPSAAIANLVAASGVADGTIDDVGAAFSQATLNNNFKELATDLAAVKAALRTHKIIAP